MNPEVIAAIIAVIPGILWVLFAIIAAVILYRPIRKELLPRMGAFQAFGIELTFLREGLENIAEDPTRSLTPKQVDQVSRRAYRSASVIRGAKILWIDDNPANNNYERRFLNSLGAMVDIVTSSPDADRMIALSNADYDLIVSDIAREGTDREGIDYLRRMRGRGVETPVIFYTGFVDEDKGIPKGAFGITVMPNELLNLTIDVLERRRG